MAAETAQPPVNGHYSTQHYGMPDAYGSAQALHVAQAPTLSTTPSHAVADPPTTAATTANEGPSKDEVGWYFVEQYYTTMSRNPERLHLFYSKRSQFVSGVEAEKVPVSVGQKAINERIKAQDIQECKVRVLNVDSQESGKNIVVQVIGEISNKSAPHRKFVQTFVLAEQPNGYFVLNDIFRYLQDEEEELQQEEPEQEPTTDPVITQGTQEQVRPSEEKALPIVESTSSMTEQGATEAVDAKLEEAAAEEVSPAPEEPSEAPKTNGSPEEVEEPAAPTVEETVPAADVTEEAKESAVLPEKLKEPEPTPAVSPPKIATPIPATEAPSAPAPKAAPKTWANIIAANRAPPPAVPTSASPAPQPKSATPAVQPQTQTPPSGPADNTQTPSTPTGNGSGWQTAGDHGKRQGRTQSNSVSEQSGIVLAYVKNVNERVDAGLLKTTLAKYGKLAYFDVSRPKSCAFVEFENPAGYNAAVAANPHQIGTEQIVVEERRPRPAAYGGSGNYGGRGGGIRGGRGGPDNRSSSQGRGGFQKDAGRGGSYTPRGGRGGGNVTPKGRGQAQAA